MVELQRPEFAYMQGKLVPWDEATIHVGTEAAIRGLNVFEGIKGYWRTDGEFGIAFLERHYHRMVRSARLLHLPFSMTFEEFREAVFELLRALISTDKDMWIRTTLFAVAGNWGEDTETDLVLTAFSQSKAEPGPINLGVSTWQRSPDVSLPARIKTGPNYQVGRLARIEGRPQGCDDMVILNQWGRVAEATGSCILMVRDGVIYSPPPTEGALESITLEFVEILANSLDIGFELRPIDRTELLIADELAICGTLAEVVPVKQIESNQVDPYGPLLTRVRERFFGVVRGEIDDPGYEVTLLTGI